VLPKEGDAVESSSGEEDGSDSDEETEAGSDEGDNETLFGEDEEEEAARVKVKMDAIREEDEFEVPAVSAKKIEQELAEQPETNTVEMVSNLSMLASRELIHLSRYLNSAHKLPPSWAFLATKIALPNRSSALRCQARHWQCSSPVPVSTTSDRADKPELTLLQRSTGLGGRSNLASNAGRIFVERASPSPKTDTVSLSHAIFVDQLSQPSTQISISRSWKRLNGSSPKRGSTKTTSSEAPLPEHEMREWVRTETAARSKIKMYSISRPTDENSALPVCDSRCSEQA
jgi:hypothetical protein